MNTTTKQPSKAQFSTTALSIRQALVRGQILLKKKRRSKKEIDTYIEFVLVTLKTFDDLV